MAPRAYWKGFLKLSLVGVRFRLFPANVRARENQLPSAQQRDGNRIRYRKLMLIW